MCIRDSLHCSLHCGLHSTSEGNTVLKLKSNVLSNQLCIFVRSLNFFDVNDKLLVCVFLKLSFNFLDLCAALTDHKTRFCGVDDDVYFVRRSLDLNLGNACAV